MLYAAAAVMGYFVSILRFYAVATQRHQHHKSGDYGVLPTFGLRKQKIGVRCAGIQRLYCPGNMAVVYYY